MPIAYNPQTNEVRMLSADGQWVPTKIAQNPQTGERLAFDGQQWQGIPKQEAPPLSTRERIGDAFSAGMQGITGGWSDELAGVIDSLTGKSTYAEGVANERENLRRFREDSPKTAAAAEIGGAILPGVLAAPLGVGTTIPRTMGLSGLLGAGEGAAYGAGTGEDAAGRLKGAALGAAAGGALGAAVPAAIEGGKAIYRGAQAFTSPEVAATNDIRRAIARDNMTPVDVAQKAAEQATVRPGVTTLADAGGPNVQGLVERIAQTPGAGRTTVIPQLEGRQKDQVYRFGRDLASLTGSTSNAVKAIEQAKAARAAAATPLYQQAYAAQLDPAAERAVAVKFQEMIDTPLGKRAAVGARQLLASSPEFRGKVTSAPLTAQIDYWQQAVRDMADAAAKAGNNNKARALRDMVGEVLGPLDQANPAFAQARAAWAGPSQFNDAVDIGYSVLSPKVSAEQWAATIQGMTPNEIDGARIGALSAINGKLQSNSSIMPDLSKDVRSIAMREKVAALMPDQAAADKWRKAVDAEVEMSAFTNQALRGPATARRLAEQKDRSGITDAAMELARGSSIKMALLHLPLNMGRGVRDTVRSKADAAAAKLLLDPNVPQALQRVAAPPAIGYGVPGMTGPALTAPGVTALSPVVGALAGRRSQQ